MTLVLHIAPHPDDECLGAPCTLLRLAAEGAKVVVVACGLGRPVDHQRRERELRAASAVTGHELVVRQPPACLASDDDLQATHDQLVPWLVELIDQRGADLVVSPHLRDAHPAHEIVALAVKDAIPLTRRPPAWWAWGIWSEPPDPTLLVPATPELVNRALAALACYRGELERNDYIEMLLAAGTLAVHRGIERVAGFGARALPDVTYAELLVEFGWVEGRWRLGESRVDDLPSLPTRWAHYVDDLTRPRPTDR
jgi:LmbE family N-acetylglucosaminyl deacetylase